MHKLTLPTNMGKKNIDTFLETKSMYKMVLAATKTNSSLRNQLVFVISVFSVTVKYVVLHTQLYDNTFINGYF